VYAASSCATAAAVARSARIYIDYKRMAYRKSFVTCYADQYVAEADRLVVGTHGLWQGV